MYILCLIIKSILFKIKKKKTLVINLIHKLKYEYIIPIEYLI